MAILRAVTNAHVRRGTLTSTSEHQRALTNIRSVIDAEHTNLHFHYDNVLLGNKRMSKSCTRALAGKVVYALHKRYVDDLDNADSAETLMGKSTVGIYSTAKAARAALRATMAKEVFTSDELPQPVWADFYVGPATGRKSAIKRLLNGEPDAEEAFEFPWDEQWRSDGTIAFHVCNLQRESDDEDETGSNESDEDSDDVDSEHDSEDEASSDDYQASTDGDEWFCTDREDAYYYELEAILIR
jgi:hypothetical protein